MICINCGAEVSSKYCPDCGQVNPPKKITFGQMYHDFQARIYGFDGMFPRTLKDVTLHPGEASKTFISGNRVSYYGPVGYFFLMATVWLLIMGLLDVSLIEFFKTAGKFGLQSSMKPGSGQEKFSQEVASIASDNMKLISFAVIPIQAFCSRFIFFRKSGFNYLENSVLPFYVQGHVYWINIINVIYYKFTGDFFSPIITGIVGVGFYSYANADFFNYQSKVKGFLKGLGVYITAQIIFITIICSVVIALIIIFPEWFEMLRPSNNR